MSFFNVSRVTGFQRLIFGFPSSINNASVFIQQRSNDLTRRYYQYLIVASTNTEEYDGWNFQAIRTFKGNPNSSSDAYGHVPQNSRAYPFEYDPVNPATSSPWHNIIFENFSQSYYAGMRALSLHFPFGEAFTDHTWLLHPLDQLYGTTGYATIYTRAGLCGMTSYNSTTMPEWCPARVKGFTGAIKQLLEGNMTPSGRTGITEYCDVFLYLPGTNGWQSYRNYMHSWWTNSAATNAARDAALTARLDQMVDFVISCKASTSNKGFLSVGLDVGSYSATPENVQLYRSLSDYKSDTCELANWYFAQKLEAAGIPVYTESRGVTQSRRAVITSNAGSTLGATGATASVSWNKIVGDENYLWYSDPVLAASKGDNYFVDRYYIDNESIPVVHRLAGSYLTIGNRLPWNMTTSVTFAGFTMEQFFAVYGDPNGSHYTFNMVYSPHYAMSQIYGCADIYMDYLYRTRGLDGWGNRRKFKSFGTYAIDPYLMCGFPVIQPGKTSGSYTWWDSQTVNTMPLFYGYGFTTSASSKVFPGYPTINYTGGFWTDGVNVGNTDTISWYNNNFRGTTFGKQLATFRELAIGYNPPNVPDPPEWLGSGPQPTPYPKYVVDDPYWNNIIDTSLR